jgi:hypothetical protein
MPKEMTSQVSEDDYDLILDPLFFDIMTNIVPNQTQSSQFVD